MRLKKWGAVVAVCALSPFAATCSREDRSDAVNEVAAAPVEPGMDPPLATASRPVTPPTAEDLAAAQVRIQQAADSADYALRKVQVLRRMEKTKLRRDANAKQITLARTVGIDPPFDFKAAVRAHRLVPLAATAPLWTVRNLNFSEPYVTPGALAMIEEIGRRFQHSLDSLNAPRYRIVVTSALRTSDKQAALRRVNRNASRIESAHEFGTTVDIAYRRFAAPVAHDTTGIFQNDSLRLLLDTALVKTASLRAGELQAVLGRVLQPMQAEGKLMVMMERSQTVYHITTARR